MCEQIALLSESRLWLFSPPLVSPQPTEKKEKQEKKDQPVLHPVGFSYRQFAVPRPSK